MKKISWLLLAVMLVLAGCGQGSGTGNGTSNNTAEPDGGANNVQQGANDEIKTPAENVILKIGASATPHAEILAAIAPGLQEQGVTLDILEFNDYVQPNVQLYEGQLDANFFQHLPYLEQFNADRGYDLVSAAGVHIEPFGVYSDKLTSIDELQDGARIAIPNDPSNGGRALLLLAQHGLITLDEAAGVEVTVSDIVDNPRNFEFVELEAATLPRVLDEVDLAAINTNYALEADLNPTEDALFIEDADSPYVNIIATRPDNKDDEAIRKLIEALHSSETETFIQENYHGAVVPAFQ